MDQSMMRADRRPDLALEDLSPVGRPPSAQGRGLLTFLAAVVLPTALVVGYLYAVAADRYASRVGFSVRADEGSPASLMLGGLGELAGRSTPDSEILAAFIRSPDLVADLDAVLDLDRVFRPEGVWDPLFTLPQAASIEAKTAYWRRMIRVDHDARTGLIDLTVSAFDPDTAQNLAREVFRASAATINALSDEARAAATRQTADDLDLAMDRLRRARAAITEFRGRHRIVDPTQDLRSQMGVLTSLEAELVDATLERDLLLETTRATDQRVVGLDRRVAVIEARITEERRKLGVDSGGAGAPGYAALMGEYERLEVDREFAERAYVAAMAAHDAALAEARRQTRFLAAHVRPTRAETPEFPRRAEMTAVAFAALALLWAVASLGYASLRDRQ